MIPIPTMEAKIKINFVFITFFKIRNSGSERPVTAIMKARVVPIATPFSVKTETKGITPATFE